MDQIVEARISAKIRTLSEKFINSQHAEINVSSPRLVLYVTKRIIIDITTRNS